jgi:hypothetical protein
MCRRSLLTVVSLPLLFAACAHRGQQRSAPEDLGGGTFCVVRPPVPAASLPSYTLAALQDSALVRAQVGQLMLYVDGSGSEDHRPVPHAIATLQEQQQPSSSLASDPPARVKLVAWGQADSVGQVVLPVLPAGRYPGQLLAWRYHPWTGHVDVRAGYTDTVRIGLSAKAPAGVVAMEPCG